MKKDAPEIHEGVERNINVTRHIEWGEVEEAFEEAEYIREDWFFCGGQAHMCMETRAAVSSYTPEGKLTIYSSNQSAYYMQALMAGVLGMREGDIRVLAQYVGGGFGGKFELDGAIFCSAILSMKLLNLSKLSIQEKKISSQPSAVPPCSTIRDRRVERRNLLCP